jgi:hypothetical protein
MLLGDGRIQANGPEAGLHERAAPEICAYYPGCCASEWLSPEGCRSTRTVTTSAPVSSCRARPEGVTRFGSGDALSMPATSPRRYRQERRRRSALPLGRRRGRQRTGSPWRCAFTVCDCRFGKDRDRCVHLAARQGGGSRRDLLGAAPRPVDAQPGGGPAKPWCLHRNGGRHRASCGPGGIAGRFVLPLGGGGGDAAYRPVRDSHHGEDPNAGPVGTRPVAHDRRRRPARAYPPTSSRPGWCSAMARLPRQKTLSSCTAPHQDWHTAVGGDLGSRGDHAAADPDRLSLLRRRTSRICGGNPRRRRPEERVVPTLAVLQQARRLGADAGIGQSGIDSLRLTPTSRHGPTESRSTRLAYPWTWPAPPN